LYGQKLTKSDIIGGLFIFVCIILISTGGDSTSRVLSDDEIKSQRINLLISVALALLVGIGLSINTLNVEYIIKKVGFPTNQINVDGNFTYGLVFLPLFIYEMY
jgi:drug/metabolite transporter (DMT)-like permease